MFAASRPERDYPSGKAAVPVLAQNPAMNPAIPTRAAPFGDHLRHWRQRRRLSQLDLAADADVSTRHLSFVETGRANPSREMVLRLCARMDVPLRERNALLQVLRDYPTAPSAVDVQLRDELLGVLMPFRLQSDAGVLNFISTTTVFGSPTDITLHEMALESFFPADDFTRTALQHHG